MGTLTTSRLRFSGNRKTLDLVGTAGRHKDAGRIEEVCVGGERRTEDGETPGQQETTEHGTNSRREVENEATDEGTPEIRTQEPSHDPGGSWLTKV
ncbi:hypothetical protein NDU88_005228 [Pleurodeles waltl]|uniref:Uncharacterized protein n=1 Tax=Pleurodeles waltl TaxID=8319 RepID=A0AAV7X025_PLEWA|nr:hypothetical protein NDU88_005228 [Pleurodeles waltl]